jgi:uncharacterized protein (DUF2126 family)
MSIRIALHHRTSYRYDRLVGLGPQLVRLRPAPHTRTPVLSYSLHVEPREHFVNWQQDPFGNYVARFVFPEKARELVIEVDLVADMTVINPFDFFLEPQAQSFPFTYDPLVKVELSPYLEPPSAQPAPPGEGGGSPLADVGPRFAALMAEVTPREASPTVDFVVGLNRRVQEAVRYVIRLEPGVQSAETTLALGLGSCRDSAWLLVQVLRQLGLAARFVSGYLVQLTADVAPLDGPAGPSADFTDLHAWAEVFLPGAGWVGLDPTSGLLAGEGHIPLAATPFPSSAAPITGAVERCEAELQTAMSVLRVHEDPRVTKPYSDAQWRAISELGQAVDERLRAGDVRLTMGGEPTFVSVDDMEGPEWTVEATGPNKMALSERLLARLAEQFGAGAVHHFGQGKWYPGEPLPRWSHTAVWRTDGVPIWSSPGAVAWQPQPEVAHPGSSERLLREMAKRLGLGADGIHAAFEDTAYAQWRAGRAARGNAAGASAEPVGHLMPLARQWWQGRAQWMTARWPTRGAGIVLVPGDSPMGLRLPLDTLGDGARPAVPEAPAWDPVHIKIPLSPAGGRREQSAAAELDPGVRTALCVEPRAGILHVFLPPVPTAEDWLELVGVAESAAHAVGVQVRLEGYLPPPDHRLQILKVTPDPGVIEVNVHPASSWPELCHVVTTLYESARSLRLGTEKFDLDGRHTGTGGGNHVVLGGAAPIDSPFLRRPDLLASFVAYWNNHPALSYLFSGKFVGPTSQAPRVDEGRASALYELSIALQQIDDARQPAPPWFVDRVFRNLLVDLTGNTHRSEICIDKLYSPDSATGRLGLVELRGFEMPPHPQMALVQALLVRALVAWFWDTPYRAPLARWGTALHDRFMLPHFVWEDLGSVLAELGGSGLRLDPEWFAPHFEFKYPLVGEFSYGSTAVEIRTALEPWYVLGEEPAGGGTVRYVDSSVERLQVRVVGLPPERYRVAVGGRPLPLFATGRAGESVAGVRFRAWHPPSCLHPSIGLHTPLVFDLVDTWAGRSVAGATFHVAHPAGRNYERFPVNANEAEARRAARFSRSGHTPGPMIVPNEAPSPEYPLTLDLRRRAR